MKKTALFVAALATSIALGSGAAVVSGCAGGGSGGGTGGADGSGGGSGSGGGGMFVFDVTCDPMPNAETAQTVFTKVAQANCVTACHTPGGQAATNGDYSTGTSCSRRPWVSRRSTRAGTRA